MSTTAKAQDKTKIYNENSAIESSDATLESVRELLFGQQVRYFERELQQQADIAASRLDANQATAQQQMDALQARCEHQFSILCDRIALLEQSLASQHQAVQESKAGRADLAQLFSELAGRLDAPSPVAEVTAIR